jgi:hypothetical protein
VIALKKKPRSTKYSDRHSQLYHIYSYCKYSARILGLIFERKTEDVLGENRSGFRRGKGTIDTIGMLRIISERILDVDNESCECFIDLKRRLTV